MSDEELYESYHNILPVFFIEDRCTDGYVNLEWKDKSLKQISRRQPKNKGHGKQTA